MRPNEIITAVGIWLYVLATLTLIGYTLVRLMTELVEGWIP